MLTYTYSPSTPTNTGKSVLVCSYTNSALDNILCKLVDMEVHLLRLGRTEAAHPDVQVEKTRGGGSGRKMRGKKRGMNWGNGIVVLCDDI